jgi:hypothetical protein
MDCEKHAGYGFPGRGEPTEKHATEREREREREVAMGNGKRHTGAMQIAGLPTDVFCTASTPVFVAHSSLFDGGGEGW